MGRTTVLRAGSPFLNGPYSVERPTTGTYVDGVYVPGTPLPTIDVDGSLQVMTGLDKQVLPEAWHAKEMRSFYTLVEMRIGYLLTDHGGDVWECVRVDAHDALRAVSWTAYLSRRIP